MKKILFVLTAFFCFNLQARIAIDITGAQSEPTPIAVPYFTDSMGFTADISKKITDVLVADLERSSLFRLVDRNAYIQHFTNVQTPPRFVDWQAIKAHALLQGQVEELPNGKLKVSFRLWDVFSSKQMAAKVLTTEKTGWRKMAHIVADEVYSRITGESGYFDSQVVFVSESGSPKKRKKQLAIMDQDGENLRYLTDGSYKVLTPRFAPNMKDVTYFSYKDGLPKVFLMNVDTKQNRLIGRFPGMTFAPRFSPDSKKLLLSMSKHGNSDIYLYDLATNKMRQLTDHPAIDTSPSFSPDGKKIVFNSDRSGSQQLYVMDANGSNVQRISFGERGGYATPVWSPRGDYIAFTKIQAGVEENKKFHIGVMRPDGSGERLIANGFLVEAPTWAPNGRVLMFFRQSPSDRNGRGGSVKLYSIDLTGHNERLIPTPKDASDPAWSPLLH